LQSSISVLLYVSFIYSVILFWFTFCKVNGIHPECRFFVEIQREEVECYDILKKLGGSDSKGCRGMWDNITCWNPADIGETVTVPCPKSISSLYNTNDLSMEYLWFMTGYISKNCTANGWSVIFNVRKLLANLKSCSFLTSSSYTNVSLLQLIFYLVVKTLYTLGYSASFIALTTGSAILCLFRKLHCTRNYIHLNLFFSFIVKTVSVFVKDEILYSSSSLTQCTEDLSLIGCKASLVIFQYCAMANYFWLLVEGLYLHTLLVAIFSENRHFKVYLLIGWGIPAVFVIAWIVARIYLEDTGCWDMTDKDTPKWIINSPIIISIVLNFLLFISIIRILVQKLMCPDVGGNDQSQYKRLAKSTLLLIPLFGVHYIVFVSQTLSPEYQVSFELAIGSFQGLVVAILYCFLNSEVQGELKRKWRSMCLNWHVSRDYGLHRSVSRNGSENTTHFHRNSRAQSFLQTETTVV
ncbi:VIPR2 protein, partial [Atractosteus spatula]|nr:VIPR2 protein [Atractosteus spatula]